MCLQIDRNCGRPFSISIINEHCTEQNIEKKKKNNSAHSLYFFLSGNMTQAYQREAQWSLLCFRPKDLRFAGAAGTKLSPNISLGASPCSLNLISFPTIEALCAARFISWASLHKRLTSWNRLRFDPKPIPHIWYRRFRSASENLFCISRHNISLSRRRAFKLRLHKEDELVKK